MRNRVRPALPRGKGGGMLGEKGDGEEGEEGAGKGEEGREEDDRARKILELQSRIKRAVNEMTLMEGAVEPKQESEKSEEWSVVSENEGVAKAEVALQQEQLVPTPAPSPSPAPAPAPASAPAPAPVQAPNPAATPASPQQEEERLEPEPVRTRIDIFEAARPTGGW